MHRRIARPLGAVGGPLVGGVLAAFCRLLNGGRGRALTATERAALESLIPDASLDAIRVVEDAAHQRPAHRTEGACDPPVHQGGLTARNCFR